jgi:hypothetical protein
MEVGCGAAEKILIFFVIVLLKSRGKVIITGEIYSKKVLEIILTGHAEIFIIDIRNRLLKLNSNLCVFLRSV